VLIGIVQGVVVGPAAAAGGSAPGSQSAMVINILSVFLCDMYSIEYGCYVCRRHQLRPCNLLRSTCCLVAVRILVILVMKAVLIMAVVGGAWPP
jgi:hypothetical protein